MNIGWSFPPTNGGRVDGFNDPGIAHFSGKPLPSLAREVIQNSLDAVEAANDPVHVSFELIKLDSAELGKDELAQAIVACKNEQRENPVVANALANAQKTISQDQILCLRVSDSNTTGLRGENWRALVKAQGLSFKPGIKGAGGSHGIGKYAPFAVSTLRTVYYWTSYQENKKDIERFQGKSVLMSHQSPHGETQGTGFYGIKEGCSELRGDMIPNLFRVFTRDGQLEHGTSLVIAGFSATKDWQRRIASSIVENFFYSIDRDQLRVIIEPDEDLESRGLLEIDKMSLGEWFSYLGDESDNDEHAEEGGSVLGQAQEFWRLSASDLKPIEKQDRDFGHCLLWIRVAEGLPSKVGFIRQTGMLITARQRNLIQFRGFRDFAALCVFEDPNGNEFLRQMENPQHDQFEYDRLPDHKKDQGRRALKRITEWIRGEIRALAGPLESGRTTVLAELATVLPDSHPDEEFEDIPRDQKGNMEPGFGERVMVSLKPIRRVGPPSLPTETLDQNGDGDSDGVDTGDVGGAGTDEGGAGGNGGGTGEGDGEGGTGIRGGGRTAKGIPLSGVRILPAEGGGNRYRLSFRSGGSGTARLTLDEAGDSSSIPRGDVRAVDGYSLDGVVLKEGERQSLEITADGPIDGRAWRLSAATIEVDGQ